MRKVAFKLCRRNRLVDPHWGLDDRPATDHPLAATMLLALRYTEGRHQSLFPRCTSQPSQAPNRADVSHFTAQREQLLEHLVARGIAVRRRWRHDCAWDATRLNNRCPTYSRPTRSETLRRLDQNQLPRRPQPKPHHEGISSRRTWVTLSNI